ncbi:MAG: hypothetical protein PHN57_07490 [Candidatus Omnitrophica bacterium]|nr:hypothetical protein [Candidatus Omnitrophota bacterium]
MISLSSLHKNPRSFKIGDVAFYEAVTHDIKTLDITGRWLLDQEWFKPLLEGKKLTVLPEEEGRGGFVGMSCMDALRRAYTKARQAKQNPEWLKFLPLELHRYMEYRWLNEEAESPDVYKHAGDIPHAGFGFVVFENGLIEDTDRALDLARLNNIRQLASLHGPIVTEEEWREYPMDFTHTRYHHSLDVCAIATLIGERCGLSDQQLKTLRVAAQSHDALTPAGGDSLKAIDPDAFNEDTHFSEVFKRRGWPGLRDRYNLREDELAEIILGKGLLGRILDASDKLAYTGFDTEQFLSRNRPGGFACDRFEVEYDRIVWLLKANPYPCSVWECAEQQNGELVFTDEERFADFLRLRALMFKILYANAAARFMEAGFVTEVAKVLYQDGIITRKKLLLMVDLMLFEIMGKALGVDSPRVMSIMPTSEDPRVNLFETFEEALAFERDIATSEPETMTHFEKAPKPSIGCHRKFKVVHCGKVLPFDQACPFHDWDIKQIFFEREPFRVFTYNLQNICPNKRMKKRLLESRNKRIAT